MEAAVQIRDIPMEADRILLEPNLPANSSEAVQMAFCPKSLVDHAKVLRKSRVQMHMAVVVGKRLLMGE